MYFEMYQVYFKFTTYICMFWLYIILLFMNKYIDKFLNACYKIDVESLSLFFKYIIIGLYNHVGTDVLQPALFIRDLCLSFLFFLLIYSYELNEIIVACYIPLHWLNKLTFCCDTCYCTVPYRDIIISAWLHEFAYKATLALSSI